MNIRQVVERLGGKQTGNPVEYEMDCWKCDGSKKLYFNTHKGVGFCQKCQAKIPLAALLAEAGLQLGLSKEALKELAQETRQEDLADAGNLMDYLADRLFGNKSQSPTVSDLPRALLPDHFLPLKEAQDTYDGRIALNYLLKRGFSETTLFQLGFGFCPTGFYGGRIIIPFYENDKLVYWQARDYLGRQDPKILNPLAKHCHVGKSEVLFNYDTVRKSKTPIVVVCESWGSALAVGEFAVGVNGTYVSETQFRKLLSLPASTFMVLFDHGAELKANRVAAELSAHRRTLVAHLPYGDPNEVPKRVLYQAVADAQPYSPVQVMKSLTVAMGGKSHR